MKDNLEESPEEPLEVIPSPVKLNDDNTLARNLSPQIALSC